MIPIVPEPPLSHLPPPVDGDQPNTLRTEQAECELPDATAGDPTTYPPRPHMAAARALLAKLNSIYEDNREAFIEAKYRAPARNSYRLAKEAEGKVVRSYKRHKREPLDHPETHADATRRRHRDYMRSYRGTDAITTREYTDLSEMTEEEKVEHKRSLARERKRRQRDRVSIDPALMEEIDRLLEGLIL